MIRLAEERHADQPSVSAETPAVIRAGEDGRIALVVAAHLHAAMPARIEKDVDHIGAVAAQDHRLLAHARDDIIAGVRDLALVTDKQPGAGEDLLLLLGVDLVVDKDLAADLPRGEIDQTGAITLRACHNHACSSQIKKRTFHRKGREGYAKDTKAPYDAKHLSSLVTTVFEHTGRCAPQTPQPSRPLRIHCALCVKAFSFRFPVKRRKSNSCSAAHFGRG